MDLLPSSDEESDGQQQHVVHARKQTNEDKKPVVSVFERLLALNPGAAALPLFQKAKNESILPSKLENIKKDANKPNKESVVERFYKPLQTNSVGMEKSSVKEMMDKKIDQKTSYNTFAKKTLPEKTSTRIVEKEIPSYISPFGHLHKENSTPAKVSTQFITQNALLSALENAEKSTANLNDDDGWLSDAVPMEKVNAKPSAKTLNKLIEKGPIVDRKRKSTTTESHSKKRYECSLDKKFDVENDENDGLDDEDEIWPQLPPLEDANNDPLVLLQTPSRPFTRSIQVNGLLNRYLQPYQREGVQWMFQAILQDRGAILGDDMGLGKTIQVIALLSALLFKTGTKEDNEVYRQRAKNRSQLTFDINSTPPPILIVVPASLLMNWELELRIWMCCRPIVLNGRPKEREMTLSTLHRGMYDIVICSYDILKANLVQINAVAWYLIVFDEMHCLKNPESQATKAVQALVCKRKLGLTGTLMQNDTDELHCLLNTIHEGSLGTLSEFRSYYAHDIKFARKKSAAPEAIDRARAKEKQLRTRLIPFYLRREKSIHPTFLTIQKFDKIVFCELTPLQLRAYRRVLESKDYQVLIRGDEMCDCGREIKRRRCCHNTGGVLWVKHHQEDEPCRGCPSCIQFPCIAQLLKLSNHLDLLRINRSDPQDVQEATKAFAEIAFGNDLEKHGGLYQAQGFFEKVNTSLCGKMVVLDKLLSVWTRKREKVLLFSRSVRMLDILQAFLISKACAYVRLDGNTRVDERLKLVHLFNKDQSLSVFLISTKAGSLGLNITSATNVVIFDPSWNPAHDCQAQDRAYRIGQTKNVKVYRLITLGTIEEMIYARQIYKQQLADTTLKGKIGPRYFEAIIGVKGQHGELFGIRNLLQLRTEGVMKALQDTANMEGITMSDNLVDLSQQQSEFKSSKVVKAQEGIGQEELEVAEELELDKEISTLAPQSMNHDLVLGETRRLNSSSSNLYTPAYLRPPSQDKLKPN
ncbi:DNA repair and recombination protein RAD26 [Thraustotheca clavata]|uniref:DNA repair and recombination protein RAD26 n=1 Tax=Thraustotheca clavata TaxID=74557 RepID=A0A1V9ZQ62_9STRA|nr:DNA repair and recombination protein RAD26 [Thraustotheca clavata]